MSHATVLVVTKEPDAECIEYQMAPFDENDAWFADGTRWDWYAIGGRWSGLLGGKDQVRVKNLKLDAIATWRRKQAEHAWREASKEKDPKLSEFIYGIRVGENRRDYLDRCTRRTLSAHAFLIDRHWHEGERMGWFGAASPTECERAVGEKEGNRCLYVHPEESPFAGARIICWWEDDQKWSEAFYRRFIQPLDPNLWLTLVDYHV